MLFLLTSHTGDGGFHASAKTEAGQSGNLEKKNILFLKRSKNYENERAT